ncbi:class I adenylate-forming enzyme family protein [Metabacillus sediminilitoris]|uniref:Long-chain fatty acid--CoA ligase n=1 Tax=Metabacillus sediminilitoris TaxID=2567941 RepID=A0A4S4BP08_9BACI|nr:long-chain fatty acid--CoA ligase [Metabacillus sediminilitoris]QGQ45561.1 AMP-binding protein [Metabacillus sediminilitoris]THF76625.1 long-chain fatty acid--CoA ligase [Metabacillus sediminilitoris]
METLGKVYLKSFDKFSQHPSLYDGKRTYTFAQLKERSLRLANALLSRGLMKGDRVAILMSNRLEHIELDVAIALAGLIKVPLNYRLHFKEHEYALENSGAKILIAEDHLVGSIQSSIPMIRVGEEYEAWMTSFPDRVPKVEIHEDDVYAIMYTSGTTGRPKGAMLTHRNILSSSLTLIIACDMTQEDIVGHVAPLTHGSNFLAHSALFLGSKQVIFNKFEPEYFLEAIEKERITTVFLVPTMVNLMIHEESFSKRDLSSLKTINMAGAPMAAKKIKLAIDLLGPKIVETFGQVEAPMTITVMPRHELGKRLTSCGATGPFVDMKIVNETGEEVQVGEIGEIICKGSLVMKGYWNNLEATAETLRDGWLHTGDLGWVDAEGYLHIVDRKKDVIISGGANTYPREVEEVLNLHPSVKETCVFGIPDEKWGESICAHVVLREGHMVTEQELIDLCKSHLASFKKPKQLHIVESLPKSPYGKILRKEIRESYRRSMV